MVSPNVIQEMMEPREAEAARVFEAVVSFCREHGGAKCFADWPEHVLREYLLFHMRQRTLVFVRTSGVVTGVAIGWQMNEADVRAAARVLDHVFQWKPTNRQGDALVFAEFIAMDTAAFQAVARALLERFNDWRQLKLFAGRHGILHEFKHATVERILS